MATEYGPSRTKGFISFGHEKIDNGIRFKRKYDLSSYASFMPDEHEIVGSEKLFTLPNGVDLTFGQIIALAGDYYGIPDAPIVDPLASPHQINSATRQRFHDAYATLAVTPYEGKHKEQLDKLLKMITEDRKNRESGKPAKCMHSNKEWDEATGGQWLAGLPVIGGYMMKLAQNNYDHFLPNAKAAYVAGHQIAIEKAKEAGRSYENDQEKLLSIAYSMDAFACHFLTDSFASGHIRTPRVSLAMNTTPSNIGHLLCKYMHDEDNMFGLRVKNVQGDKWISYGDGMLMKECSKENFHLVVKAVQTSINQVYQASENPDIKLNSSAVTDLIPFIDEEEKNNTPLFQVRDGKIHRRANINDLQDTKTVTNWWGFSTAISLQNHKPENSAI